MVHHVNRLYNPNAWAALLSALGTGSLCSAIRLLKYKAFKIHNMHLSVCHPIEPYAIMPQDLTQVWVVEKQFSLTLGTLASSVHCVLRPKNCRPDCC